MPDEIMEPVWERFDAVVTPPGSKSQSNRALILAALAGGDTELSNLLLADDTEVMLDGLGKLGFELDLNRKSRVVSVRGECGKIPAARAELFCGNSGTTIRFLAALCALGKGEYSLDGTARMRERPIGELMELLKNLGVRTHYLGEKGFPPVRISADALVGGRTSVGAAMSSQFLSAVLMASPYARHEVRVDLTATQTSWPYVTMTMRMMDEFGVTPEVVYDPKTGEPREIIVPRDMYAAGEHVIEPDASNASYFLAAAAIHPGSTIRIAGLGKKSLQGDIGFAEVLGKMGAEAEVLEHEIRVTGRDKLAGIEVDLAGMPDVAQTLAVVALFARGVTTLRGLATLRVKETDRLAALAAELTKLGARVETDEESLTIEPPREVLPAAIATYDDHRMAMSFAVAGTRAAGIVIQDAQCVNKTYPGFFGDLRGVLLAKGGKSA